MSSWRKRTRSATYQDARVKVHKTKRTKDVDFQHRSGTAPIPHLQSAILLHAVRQPYSITYDYDLPTISDGSEMLVKVGAVGLNPIDWKAPDFNFGIPSLPYLAGREYAGVVVKAPRAPESRIKIGDVVAIPSTDYRDHRKAAFQQYSVASSFNAIRLPKTISVNSGSILGVAFVSAALALGICMGLDFSSIENGPDLLEKVRALDEQRLPEDIRQECLRGIASSERAKPGDFLVIWGGSSTCAHAVKQIARVAGIRIISIVDTAKHGLRISSTDATRPDLIVDAHDPARAIEIIKAATNGRARFGLDVVGKDTARQLMTSLAGSDSTKGDIFKNNGVKSPTPPSTPPQSSPRTTRSHLVGMTGLPKDDIPDSVALHSVPIKLFHEVPEIGEALSSWCERLLVKELLVPPEVVGTVDGLDGINEGLDKMRKREVSGGRLVAELQ